MFSTPIVPKPTEDQVTLLIFEEMQFSNITTYSTRSEDGTYPYIFTPQCSKDFYERIDRFGS